MTSIGEIIQRVQSEYSRGVASKDSNLTDRHVYSCVTTGRSIVLQQKANKSQFMSSWNYQTLPCVELIDAPLNSCPCSPKGLTMLRSKHKLPKIVSAIDGSLIGVITTLDNSIAFDERNYGNYKYNAGRKYASNKPFSMIYDGYLFVGAIKKLKAVPLTAIFHDPVEAAMFPSICEECLECQCASPFDLEFPIDGELIDGVIKIANQEAIILLKQINSDNTNNAADDTATKGAMIH